MCLSEVRAPATALPLPPDSHVRIDDDSPHRPAAAASLHDQPRNSRQASVVGEVVMIELAIGARVIGVIASALGFTKVAGVSYAIAKVIGVIFLLVFVVLLLAGLALF
jgi:uncharacterized membrane protein YtjA (UPF0391 family)